MVINPLHHAHSAEPHGLTDAEAREHEREGGTDGVEEEGFSEGVVEGAEGIGDVELMMVRVEVACRDGGKLFGWGRGERGRRRTVQPFVGVHGAVPEVLPAVAEEDCDAEAGGGLEEIIYEFRGP